MIKRIRYKQILSPDPWHDGTPYILDTRSIDITDMIVAMIRNAPEGLIALSLRYRDMLHLWACERAARQRGARIIWIRMPDVLS